jgi:anti-sigma28 factor (negative regulator of flagellin synthesis)
MKNNTKVRLHLSKQLFESLTKEIIKEAKANDGYTVAVKQPKMPKQSKSQATSPEVQKTDTEAMMGEVHSQADTKKMEKMKEMEMNVAEEGTLNEIDPGTIDWSIVAAGLGAIGLTPFLIDKIHDLWKKKFPKSFKKAQGLSGAIDRQAGGNEPGDKDRQIKTGGF